MITQVTKFPKTASITYCSHFLPFLSNVSSFPESQNPDNFPSLLSITPPKTPLRYRGSNLHYFLAGFLQLIAVFS